jgi:branched-chain amino acid transport system permease protein
MPAVLSASLENVSRWAARYSRALALLALLAAVAYPLVVRRFYISLAEDILIYALFALSLDLLLGHIGLASFGHAAYFGLGAYTVAFVTTRLGLNNLLITVPLVLAVTGTAAALIGFLALRTSGVYYLMVTLAFAQMLFSVALSWAALTGGSDGLPGVPRPAVALGPYSYVFASRASGYYLLLGTLLLAAWLLGRIAASPFGLALHGIRENEVRMQALGYNTLRYKLAAVTVGGALAGLAGLLLAHTVGTASPENLYWTTSGQVLIMLVVGGTGSLPGPVLGALVVRLLRNLLSSVTDRWETVLGVVFILFVVFARRGVAGWFPSRHEEAAQ